MLYAIYYILYTIQCIPYTLYYKLLISPRGVRLGHDEAAPAQAFVEGCHILYAIYYSLYTTYYSLLTMCYVLCTIYYNIIQYNII